MSAFPVWAWVGFTALIVVLLLLDLLVLARGEREISFRQATILSLFWIVLALLFGVVVFAVAGPERGGEYLAGYLIEKSLSVDNVFVFALIFSYFAVPTRYQYRVLFWGVVGALVLRAVFIALGAQLLERYDWMVYVFGVFLIYTGIRMAFHRDEEVHPERNPVLLLVRRMLPMTSDFQARSSSPARRGSSTQHLCSRSSPWWARPTWSSPWTRSRPSSPSPRVASSSGVPTPLRCWG
jgi:tellurite resistance protein TerC